MPKPQSKTGFFIFLTFFQILGISVAPTFSAIVVPVSDGGRGYSVDVCLCL
jgi:hypothetical protein